MLPASLSVVFPLPFSSKLTLDFLGGLEQHPVPHRLSKTVCTGQDISQVALTDLIQRPQHDWVFVFPPGLVLLWWYQNFSCLIFSIPQVLPLITKLR